MSLLRNSLSDLDAHIGMRLVCVHFDCGPEFRQFVNERLNGLNGVSKNDWSRFLIDKFRKFFIFSAF